MGQSLLQRALRTASEAGFGRAVVITGYHAPEVGAHARAAAARAAIELDVVHCRRWTEGNGASLLAAEAVVDEGMVVLMVDHLIPAAFLRQLTAAESGDAVGLLLVDGQPARVHDLDEATKVRLNGNRIAAIGKALRVFNAVDTGVFRFDQRVFDALRHEVARGRAEISAAVQRLASRGQMHAVLSDGSFWCDVDTPEDLAYARRVLKRRLLVPRRPTSDRLAGAAG